MTREVRMINSARSLESMRDLGIDLETGLKELVDNSIDASATRLGYISRNPRTEFESYCFR